MKFPSHPHRSLLSRLRRIDAQEWRDLARAQAALLRAWFTVRTRPRGRLVVPAWTPPAARPTAAARHRARVLAWAIDRVADVGPVPATCLVRALALHHCLDAEGIHGARVCVGVQRGDGRLTAHAWVELDGHPLGSPGRDRSRFVTLTTVSTFAGRQS